MKKRSEKEKKNKKRWIKGVSSILLVTLLVGCLSQPEEYAPAGSPEIPEFPEIPDRGYYMGFLPMPIEGQSLEEAYGEAAAYCEFIPVWGRPTPFYELADELSGSWGKTFVDTYIKGNGMIPLIHLSFMDVGVTLKKPPGMEDATLSDPEWRESYKKAALDVVKVSKPHFLSLGNEVNRWYEKYGLNEDPNGFQHYVTLYEDIYDAVKEISPETTVFCTFSREIVSENREANLDVLQLFNLQKMDILVFTSYPYALPKIMNPSDMPDDYYVRALEYMPGKPVGFSEVAWSSLDAFGGEQGQADFLLQMCGRLTINQGVDLYFLGWPWLVDLSEDISAGLIKRDGTEKLAYTVWKDLFTGEIPTYLQFLPDKEYLLQCNFLQVFPD